MNRSRRFFWLTALSALALLPAVRNDAAAQTPRPGAPPASAPGAWMEKPAFPKEPSRAGGRTLAGEFVPQSERTRPAAPAPPLLLPFDVRYYGLDLTPEVGQDSLAGTATLLIHVTTADLVSVTLDAVRLAVKGVTVNGLPRPWSVPPDSLTLSIEVGGAAPGDSLRQPGDSIWVAVDYGARPKRGYYGFERCTYTFTEPENSRAWFPCADVPRDKARFEGWFAVPQALYAASNGVLVGTAPAGGGRTRWHWREDHPIATYLICMTISDYAVMRADADGIPLLYLTYPEDTTKAKADFARVPEMMRFLATTFEPYPFDKYGMAAVEPFYNIGAMEHQTMTTINRVWLRGDGYWEPGILHELAHMWFGDSVTPYDWSDIWLNEGFARYCEALWLEDTEGTAGRTNLLAVIASAYFGEFSAAKYPISDPPRAYLFGSTIYDKGAWVLHMLRRQVGDAAFLDILRRHLAENRYGNASIGGFRVTAEAVSGQDLAWFFDQWLDDVGYPVLEYAFETSSLRPNGPYLVTLHLGQTQESIGAPLFRIPLEVAIRTAGGERRETVQLSGLREESFGFWVDAAPTGVTLDPDYWLLKRISPRSSLTDAEPAGVRVHNLYPNPAAATARLEIRVPHLGPANSQNGQTARWPVRADLFDLRGRQVRTVVDGEFGPGLYAFSIDQRDGAGNELRGGVYFLRVISGPGAGSGAPTLTRVHPASGAGMGSGMATGTRPLATSATGEGSGTATETRRLVFLGNSAGYRIMTGGR